MNRRSRRKGVFAFRRIANNRTAKLISIVVVCGNVLSGACSGKETGAGKSAAHDEHKYSESLDVDETLRQLSDIAPTINFQLNSRHDGIRVRFTVDSLPKLSLVTRILHSSTWPIEIECADKVHLSEADCHSISTIGTLEVLDLHECAISGDGIFYLLHSMNLKSLNLPNGLDDKQLQKIDAWPSSLQCLYLGQNTLPDVAWRALANVKSLSTIDVARQNQCLALSESAWHTLILLPQLKCLQINIGSSETVQQLANLKHLETVILVGDESNVPEFTRQDGASLTNLSQCKFIYLSAVYIGKGALSELGKVPQLTRLTLENCDIDPLEQREFDRLGQILSLDVPFSTITSEAVHAIARLHNLTSLNLTATDVGDTAIEELISLQQLSSIQLGHTQITDRGFKAVVRLPQLKTAEVQSTLVSDDGLASIDANARIERLGLRNTKVGASGISKLATLPCLKALDIGGIKIDSSTSEALSKSESLEELYAVNCTLDDESLQRLSEI